MKSVKIHIAVVLLLSSLLLTPLCRASFWGDNPNISFEHQKMISTIEYKGNGQFHHQVDTLLTIEKESLSDQRKRYSISSSDFSFSGSGVGVETASNNISFIIDEKTGLLSESAGDEDILEKVNNYCVNSVKHVTKDNIGKTWKQSFDLSSFVYSLPNNLTFTMTAINVNTEKYGVMIAVRALSEPFVVNIINSKGEVKEVKSRIRTAYLFDSKISEIYLSMSVFDAAADISSKNEKLRYEVATYKTDENGTAVDLSGLGKDFENFVRKVSLTSQDLKIEKETALPQWAQSEGLRAMQLANICAAVACEGALNPVTTVTIPQAKTVALQSSNSIASVQDVTPTSTILAKDVPAMKGMKISTGPAFAGNGLITVGNVTAIAGAVAGGIAIVEYNDDDDSSSRSPVVP